MSFIIAEELQDLDKTGFGVLDLKAQIEGKKSHTELFLKPHPDSLSATHDLFKRTGISLEY